MKKFKRIFYPIYLIFSVGFIYLSIDAMSNMETKLTWFDDKFSSANQPYWIVTVFLLLSILMLVEMIAENIHLRQVKSGIGDLEDEVTRLKAKLFDRMDHDDIDDLDEEGEDDDDD